MKLLFVVLLVTTLCGCVYTAPKSYSGYQVFNIFPTNDYQTREILALRRVHHELDFWSDVAVDGRPLTVKAPPLLTARLTHFLDVLGVRYEVAVPDVGKNIEEEQQRLRHRQRPYDPNNFNTLADIEARLLKYVTDCPVGFSCEVVDLGLTFEGRNIKRFSIYQGTGRRAYWVDSNIHAREWLSSATNLRFMDNFVYNNGSDPDVTRLLDTYDWHFVPIMNPDGYEFTWTNDRYWRKSRTDHSTAVCKGVDLNRNYDVLWGQSGTSDQPCAETFGGEGPASCIETQILQTEITRLTPTLDALVSMHTYAHYILHPYGHEDSPGVCATAPDHDDLIAAATDMADAILATNGRQWDFGKWCVVLYPSSGTTMDYAYRSGAGVKYSYTPELRGTDFVIDPVNIQPSFEEMWAALVALEGYASTN